MKKFLLAGVAFTGLVAGAGAVSAADLPARTAPIAPVAVPAVPIFTWTGFYVGVNAGYGWQNNDQNSFFVPAGTFGPGTAGGTVSFADDEGDGFVGGGQIGYNYQIGSFVVGLETDLQWADLGGSDGTAFFPDTFPRSFVPAGAGGGVDWFGTLRARFGFAFDRALVYATGGFAYGGTDNGDNWNGLFGDDEDDTRTGWALGGGVEYAFTNNLTFGLEGLWVNLDGDKRGTFIGTVEDATGDVVPVYSAGVDRGDDENDFFVARAKLNFKF